MGQKEELKAGVGSLFAAAQEIPEPSVVQLDAVDVERPETVPAETLSRAPVTVEEGIEKQWVVFERNYPI